MNVASAPPNATKQESVDRYAAARRVIRVPASMISSDRRTISGLRRSSTPSAPVANRNADTPRYQAMSGPRMRHLRVRAAPRLAACVRAEDDAADRGHEQHDRRDLEREQMV